MAFYIDNIILFKRSFKADIIVMFFGANVKKYYDTMKNSGVSFFYIIITKAVRVIRKKKLNAVNLAT